MNVVTACISCNEIKNNCTPEEAHMELIYLPYVPMRSEYLILSNRHVLYDQMKFLLDRVSSNSRLLARKDKLLQEALECQSRMNQ